MTTAFDVLVERVEGVVRSFPKGKRFSTHKFILRLAHRNQAPYVAALHESDSDRPFHSVHIKLGKILKERVDLVEDDKEVVSKDIFRNKSECSFWIRTI